MENLYFKEERTMFENKTIEGIHISRFLASWINAGGRNFDGVFVVWLMKLRINGRKLTDDEIRDIQNFGRNGKLELEEDAELFLDNYVR